MSFTSERRSLRLQLLRTVSPSECDVVDVTEIEAVEEAVDFEANNEDKENNDGLEDEGLLDGLEDEGLLDGLEDEGLLYGLEDEGLLYGLEDEGLFDMPSLPEPDPVRYFMMNHRLYKELLTLAIRYDTTFIPFATRATSLDKVEYLVIQHFPPRNRDIQDHGIFHSNKDDRMPAEQSWCRVLKCTIRALGRHGLDEANATKFLMDRIMGANLHPVRQRLHLVFGQGHEALVRCLCQGGKSSSGGDIQGPCSGLPEHQGGSRSWRGAFQGNRWKRRSCSVGTDCEQESQRCAWMQINDARLSFL